MCTDIGSYSIRASENEEVCCVQMGEFLLVCVCGGWGGLNQVKLSEQTEYTLQCAFKIHLIFSMHVMNICKFSQPVTFLFHQDPEKPGDKPRMQTYDVDLNTYEFLPN